MKTSELTGAALDWAVKKCQPLPDHGQRFAEDGYHPSTDWAQGGPIIERERITLDPRQHGVFWVAYSKSVVDQGSYGPTPLIAAMRCYVASLLGDDVEIPEELREKK